jgi:hypothetical protein
MSNQSLAKTSRFKFERLEERIAPSALSALVDPSLVASPKDDFSIEEPPKDDFSSEVPPKDDTLACHPHRHGHHAHHVRHVASVGRHSRLR